MILRRLGLIIFAFALWGGCSTVPPLDEYTYARTAILSAKQHEAQRYAPAYWHEAEESFRSGEDAFKKESYKEAREEFEIARRAAEKAENISRIQRFKNGDSP